MAAKRCVVAVVMMVVTYAGPSLAYPQVMAQEAKAPRSSLTDVTPDVNSTATMSENGVADSVNNEMDVSDGEIEQSINLVTSLQNPAREPTTFERILGVVIYAIETYSTSASLREWLAGLGKAASYDESHGTSRLLDLIKFSPIVVEYVEALRPLGFTPYPDPYEPIGMSKKDVWKGILNWLATFGLISLFWRAYLPLPDFVYEKFGFPEGHPGYYDYYDFHEDDEEEEEGEEEEEDPYDHEEEDEEEEEEEEEDPYGHEEEDEEEHNYYKVGEEEKEREHESFAVFKQKETESEDETHAEDDIHSSYHGIHSSYQHYNEYAHRRTDHHTLGYQGFPPRTPGSRYAPGKQGGGQSFRPSFRPSNGNYLTSRQVGGNRKPKGPLRYISNRNRRKGVQNRPAQRIGQSQPESSSSSSSSSSFPFNLFSFFS